MPQPSFKAPDRRQHRPVIRHAGGRRQFPQLHPAHSLPRIQHQIPATVPIPVVKVRPAFPFDLLHRPNHFPPLRKNQMWPHVFETFRTGRVLCECESSDSIRRMVHSVHALLAHRAAGIASSSPRLASVLTVAAYWRHDQCSAGAGSGSALSAGPSARMAET